MVKTAKPWKVLSRFAEIKSPWLTVIGESLEEKKGTLHEYWRVEKPDGLLIITLHKDQIILPQKMYRPGVGEYTLDFCGGRVDSGHSISEQAIEIVSRELRLTGLKAFKKTRNLYKQPLNVDSSFTNVKINAFVAEIPDNTKVDYSKLGGYYPQTAKGVKNLLNDLLCLQCRAVLLEWKEQVSFVKK